MPFKRLVKIEMIVPMLVTVSDEADEDYIDFWLNESSHCSLNEIDQFNRECSKASPGCCNTCARVSFKVVDLNPTEDYIKYYIEDYGDPRE